MWYKHNNECCILSCGRFLGVWIFCADISEHYLFPLHITYEDGTDRQFKNIVTENSDAWNQPKERIQHSHTVKAWNQNSVVQLLLYGLNELGFESWQGKILLTSPNCQDLLWGSPSSPLFNGCPCSLPWVKQLGHDVYHWG